MGHFCDYLLLEYSKLKDEQTKRIGFRDQMIYLTLAAIGGIYSFALQNSNFDIALLVLPFLLTILAWVYIANDNKISLIGEYLRVILLPKIQKCYETDGINESWEYFVRNIGYRKKRKITQFVFDTLLFVLSGAFSICYYLFLHSHLEFYYYVIAVIEFSGLAFILIQFYINADF